MAGVGDRRGAARGPDSGGGGGARLVTLKLEAVRRAGRASWRWRTQTSELGSGSAVTAGSRVDGIQTPSISSVPRPSNQTTKLKCSCSSNQTPTALTVGQDNRSRWMALWNAVPHKDKTTALTAHLCVWSRCTPPPPINYANLYSDVGRVDAAPLIEPFTNWRRAPQCAR